MVWRNFLAFVFLSSAALKSLYPADFVKFIASATSVSYIHEFLAVALFGECLIACMLLVSKFRLLGLFLAATYVFVGSIWYTVLRQQGFVGSCGCFGGLDGGFQLMLVRNGVIVAIAGIAFVLLYELRKQKEASYEY